MVDLTHCDWDNNAGHFVEDIFGLLTKVDNVF